MVPKSNDPAEARKRRKEIIQSQRSENEAAASSSNANLAAVDSSVVSAPEVEEKKPPKKRKVEEVNGNSQDKSKKKTQIRYDPDVPMNKEQLAAWRREARRVRNRESAAASRQRIRNRISELEDEVGQWKSKYTQAIDRLQALEQSIAAETEAASKN